MTIWTSVGETGLRAGDGLRVRSLPLVVLWANSAPLTLSAGPRCRVSIGRPRDDLVPAPSSMSMASISIGAFNEPGRLLRTGVADAWSLGTVPRALGERP